MPKPIAICIENLNARSKAKRYLRCVALPGRQPGLRLGKAGQVLWKLEDIPSCELWVSADERLILYRQEGMVKVNVERAGRTLDVPFSKPVVLADQDQITVGRRKLRVHIHGIAQAVSAPSPLTVSPAKIRSLARTATAAAMIGAVMTLGSCDALSTVEVRTNPPEVVLPSETATPTVEVRDFPPEVVIVETVTAEAPTPTPTIEVRDFPPTATPIGIPVVQQPSLAEILQGEWMVSQVYDINGEQTWVTGLLVVNGSSYIYTPAVEMSGSSMNGVLDFLFTYPSGSLSIDYPSGLAADSAFEGFAPGDLLATFIFAAETDTVHAFDVRLRDATSLQFTSPTGELDLWSVVKEMGIQ